MKAKNKNEWEIIELREAGSILGGQPSDLALGEAVEARQRSRQLEPGESFAISIKEPRKPGAVGKPKSESAANGGTTIDIQENSTMSTQPSALQESHNKMADAFTRLGLSAESAQSAARGRNTEVGVGDLIPASMRESMNRIDGVGSIQPGAVVIYHPTEAELSAAAKFEESRRVDTESRDRLAEAFERMGMSPNGASLAARGRG